ncbi:Niemann-Pick type protein 1B [Schistosoma japonicum]|uniref:Niemann-Pick type protein 1B n=1 Tax=Schistosoma japonicum TaxID=6182 RepID=A0A4Z2DPQ9_SCHJA|nr:Niemann-Pick type protein 1B [Schistosoma japonicum]
MVVRITSYIFVYFFLRVHFASSDCIWYGICESSDPVHPRYCSYNGTAKALSNDGFKVLSKLCPNYAVGNAKVCCDESQLDFFSRSASLAAMLLKRCPACFANFRLLFCAMTCDPNQAQFITPAINGKLVESITYTLTDHMADTFFNSCKEVTFGSGRAISLMCGTVDCTRQLLLENLGKSTGGGRSPFDIHFNVVNSLAYRNNPNIRPFDSPGYQCNQPVPKRASDPGGSACSCVDCSSSCSSEPPDLPPQPSKPKEIFGIDVWLISGYIVFSVLTITFSTYHIIKLVYNYDNASICSCWTSASDKEHLIHHQHQLTQTESQQANRICLLAYLTAYFNKILTKMFRSLGGIIVQHPLIVLVISLVVILILSGGFVFLQVTTDPVELWSGKESRSRLEKNYFDQQFGPFYRIEQIIIQPKNSSNFTHKALGDASGDALFGAGLNKDFLLKVIDLQSRIQAVSVYFEPEQRSFNLSDICFQPLEPDNHGCAITSPIEYFQNNLTLFNTVRKSDFDLPINDYLDHLLFCTEAPLSTSGSPLDPTAGCLSSSGMPVLPQVALASFNASFYNGSRGVVLTFLVRNTLDPKSIHIQKAKLWESHYLKLVSEWKHNNTDLSVSFQAERSVEDEIERQSTSDISTIAISYIVMFIYVSLFLGTYRSFKTIFVDMRITLGFAGVLIVLASVVASVGFWSYFKLPITLIIIEVIPFLVLAIGVDNIFILVHEFEHGRNVSINDVKLLQQYIRQYNEEKKVKQRQLNNESLNNLNGSMLNLTQNEQHHPEEQDQSNNFSEAVKKLVEDRIVETVGNVGPSILLTGLSESVAFFCGSLTTMPAVRVFALYAAMAVVFNFLLQIFAFIALLTLDGRRYVSRRFDVLFCMKLDDELDNLKEVQETITSRPLTAINDIIKANSVGNDANKVFSSDSDSLSLSSTAMDDDIHEIDLAEQQQRPEVNKNASATHSWLHYAVANFLSPVILSGWARPCIIIVSLAWLCFAAAILPNGLHLSLDQKLSMPTDSYMLDYFNALDNDLRVGPPVYFVVTEGHNFTTLDGQNQVCGGTGCSNTSLIQEISSAAVYANRSWIASPASSWLDDYFDWIDPSGSTLCCRIYQNTSKFCPPDSTDANCTQCPVYLDNGRPNPIDFYYYLPQFLRENPGSNCPKGGKAAYSVGVRLLHDNISNGTLVGANYFMAYHSVLKKPDDYVNALKAARYYANKVTQSWYATTDDYTKGPIRNNSVFPYRLA